MHGVEKSIPLLMCSVQLFSDCTYALQEVSACREMSPLRSAQDDNMSRNDEQG